jgi:hypothetical protein
MAEMLRTVYEPGEQEAAGVMVIQGPSPWLVAGVGGLIFQFLVKYYFVAVTDRRVIFIRTSRWSQRPIRVERIDPRESAAIMASAVNRVWSWFKYRGPDGKVLKENVHRIWRDELTPLLQSFGVPTTESAGATSPPPPPSTPAPPAPPAPAG